MQENTVQYTPVLLDYVVLYFLYIQRILITVTKEHSV